MARRVLLVTVLALGVCACRSTDVAVTALTRSSATIPEHPAPTSSTTTTTTTRYVPVGVDADSTCLRRAEFGDPAASEYRLPFPVGESYIVSQSYCLSGGGHRDQLAYDFVMPIGTDVVASRAGTVRLIREDSPDDGERAGEHNYVFIEHDDGTVAFYAHLMQDGVDVERGDIVEAGRRIAASGNSGLTVRAHLHFGIYRSWPPEEGFDVPVNFSNAGGILDPNGGLMRLRRYEALP